MGMVVEAVMTRDVVTVSPDDSWLSAVRAIEANKVHALPVVGADRKVVGIVSESDLMAREERLDPGKPWIVLPRLRHQRQARARTVRAAMTRRCVTVSGKTPLGEAARLMHRRRVGRLPVVDAEGRLEGIVSRSDLLSVFLRADAELEAEVRDAVSAVGATGADVTVRVVDAMAELTGSIRYRSHVDEMRRMALQVPGIVDVVSRVEWEVDDTYVASAGM